MFKLKNKLEILILLFIVFALNSTFAQTCPSLDDLLNKGYSYNSSDPHDPQNENNGDEIGIVDLEPFLMKVDYYPPIRSFPKTPVAAICNGEPLYFYQSFDTGPARPGPIPYIAWHSNWHTINVFRNNGEGYTWDIKPPVEPMIPDIVMNFDGSLYAIAYDQDEYPEYAYDVITRNFNPVSVDFEVEIIAPDYIGYGKTVECIADVNGGDGKYTFDWKYKELPAGDWSEITSKVPDNYFIIQDVNPPYTPSNYYWYDDEYKYQVEGGNNDILVSVTVKSKDENSDLITTTAEFIIEAVSEIKLVNKIQSDESYGQLVYNESTVVNSGATILIDKDNYNSNNTVRTDELPFIYDYNSTSQSKKHINWGVTEISNVLNYQIQFDEAVPAKLTANFNSTSPVTIKNVIDGMDGAMGKIYFKDPWYYYKDAFDNWYQSDEFKQYSSPFDILNNSESSYGGVFLGQSGPPSWPSPYYSIEAPQEINVNGKNHQLYFQNWEAIPAGEADFQNTSSSTGIVFHDAGVTVQANMKGSQITGDPDAYKFNSQTKIVCTPDDGYLHSVYESMGHVWYEMSKDGGSTWQLMNNGNPLDPDGGRCPSISYCNNTAQPDEIFIIFQQREIYEGEDVSSIIVKRFKGNTANATYEYIESFTVSELLLENYYDKVLLPVITSFAVSKTEAYFIAAWRRSYDCPDPDYSVYGIHWQSAARLSFDGNWSLLGYNEVIPNTVNASTSSNPSLAAEDDDASKAYLVFQQKIGSVSSYIRFYSFDINYGRITLDESSFATISNGSGYYKNIRPSVSVSYHKPYVLWIGDYEVGGGGASKTTVNYGQRAVLRYQDDNGNWVPTFLKYGADIQSPNINQFDNISRNFVFSWSEILNDAIKFVKGPYFYQIHTADNAGSAVQVSNGSDFQSIYLNSFNNSSLPYYFDLKPVESSASKTTAAAPRYGREGILSYGRTEYYFAVADILNGEEVIEFVDLEDSPTLTINELNDVLYTKAFTATEGTPVYFSVMYGIADTTGSADLSEEEYVNYKVELIDESTGEVIGEYDNVTYDAENTFERKLIAYEINTEGIGSREVRLRLAVITNTDAVYTLGELVNDEQIISKQGSKTISYAGSLEMKEYALSQNYPNPFNPTTNIVYQIPKEGRVVIKLYDILGREIQTLVNEHKTQGTYEFTFDGSKLSSGVYIYRITAGEFTASKKFVLMK